MAKSKMPASSGRGSGPPRRPVSDDPELVELVAYLTWGSGGWTPARDVVKELQQRGYPSVNVHGVLACQRAAVDRKLVIILHELPHERCDVLRLEGLLVERFKQYGIRRVCLVPGEPAMLQETDRDRRREIHARITLKLAERAARHAGELIAHRPAGPYRIGVAWGRMMHAFAQRMLGRPPATSGNGNLKVYPIVGITDAEQSLPIEANGIASIVARALGGVSAQLQCPAIVRSDQYELATSLEPVQKMLRVIQTMLDIVFTGMGPIEHALDASDITITPDPTVNATLFEAARHRASGEICYWCFDQDGRPVEDLPYRSIGLGLDGLKTMAADPRGRRVVLITGGDVRRIAPLLAAIRGSLVTDLITDTVTARVLIGELMMP